jgi:hypothetical protein
MTAFDPTPLRPDAPALPSLKVRQPSAQQLAFDPFAKAAYSEGLTARQHAAIALCVPDSGTPWLDAMIERRQRDEFAAKAMQGIAADPSINPPSYEIVGQVAYEMAAAMLAASKKEPA